MLKRSSSFKESYQTLLDLDASIRKHLETVEQGSIEYNDAFCMLYKTVREQARINSLLKNLTIERRCEKLAWEMFTQIYGQVEGWV